MNLVMLTEQSSHVRLPADDARTQHVLNVFGAKPGDQFYVGVENGPRGTARIDSISDGGEISLNVEWHRVPPSPWPVTLMVGLPRPQTARKLLRECTSLGVQAFVFFGSERGESSYARSKLWSTGEWSRLLREGAEQAFATHIPSVSHLEDLQTAIASSPSSGTRIALDIYESTAVLSELPSCTAPVLVALGGERGWSSEERNILRQNGFAMAHMGERVLRTESAAIAALSVLSAKNGWLGEPFDIREI